MLSELRELLRYRELFLNLVVRDLKARYKHSVLGFFWSLLNPLAQIATLTIVFKMIMRTKIDNYAPFLMTAFVPWTFFQLGLLDACASLLQNATVLKRVYFPREVLPLSGVAANLIHFMLAMVVLFGYLMVVGVHFAWGHLIYLPLIILAETMLVAGLALLVSCASVYFQDIYYLLTMGMNLLYFGSCIFYPLYGNAQVPGLISSRFGWVAHLNPVVPLVTLYRQAILARANVPDAGPIQLELLWRVFAFGLGFLIVGYLVFNWRKWEFAERT